jgi:hypothetical protein
MSTPNFSEGLAVHRDEEIHGAIRTQVIVLMLKGVLTDELPERCRALALSHELTGQGSSLEFLEPLIRYVAEANRLRDK